MRNPLGGQVDSKAAYYRSVKQAGCEIVGNDPRGRKAPDPERYTPKMEDVVEDVKRSYSELEPLSQPERDNMMRAYEGPQIKELPSA